MATNVSAAAWPAEREARALITQLASDLSTATFPQGRPSLKNPPTSWPADRLGFLSLQPAEAQSDAGRIGDLCAVNYYIKDLTIGGKTVRCLMRGFRESKETFKALEDGRARDAFRGAGEHRRTRRLRRRLVRSPAQDPATPAGKWIDWVKNDTTGPEALDVRLVLARRELAGETQDNPATGTAPEPPANCSASQPRPTATRISKFTEPCFVLEIMRMHKSRPHRDPAAGFTLPAVLVVVGALLILAVGILLVAGIERRHRAFVSSTASAPISPPAPAWRTSAAFSIIEAANDDFIVLQSTLATPIAAGRDPAPQLFLARGKKAGTAFSYRYVPLFSAANLPADDSLLAPPKIEPLVGDQRQGMV